MARMMQLDQAVVGGIEASRRAGWATAYSIRDTLEDAASRIYATMSLIGRQAYILQGHFEKHADRRCLTCSAFHDILTAIRALAGVGSPGATWTTKEVERAIEWGMRINPETLVEEEVEVDRDGVRELVSAVFFSTDQERQYVDD